MSIGDRLQLLQAGGSAKHVHDQNCRGPWRDLRFHVGRIEVEGLVDLGENRRSARVDDRRDRGDVREAGHDHLVAGSHAEAQERDPDRGRAAAVEGQGVSDAGCPGDRLLDVMDLRPERRVVRRAIPAQEPAGQHLQDLSGLLLSNELDPGSGH